MCMGYLPARRAVLARLARVRGVTVGRGGKPLALADELAQAEVLRVCTDSSASKYTRVVCI